MCVCTRVRVAYKPSSKEVAIYFCCVDLVCIWIGGAALAAVVTLRHQGHDEVGVRANPLLCHTVAFIHLLTSNGLLKLL